MLLFLLSLKCLAFFILVFIYQVFPSSFEVQQRYVYREIATASIFGQETVFVDCNSFSYLINGMFGT